MTSPEKSGIPAYTPSRRFSSNAGTGEAPATSRAFTRAPPGTIAPEAPASRPCWSTPPTPIWSGSTERSARAGSARSPFYGSVASSKILSQHRRASAAAHPYNVVLELGADFSQGRYVDDEILERHRREKGNTMLCELVFLFDAPLREDNGLRQPGPSFVKPVVDMKPSPAADPFLGEIGALKDWLIRELGGIALPFDDLNLKWAPLGGVAHEVGTLRLGDQNDGAVDADLKFLGYDNLYACDLSVFPSSPAANPTLTLAALAIRLAEHLKSRL